MNRKINIETDQFGRLANAVVHDSVISSFAYSAKEGFRLEFNTSGSVRTAIDLRELKIFTVRELWDGAICSHVLIVPLSKFINLDTSMANEARQTLFEGRAAASDVCSLLQQYLNSNMDLQVFQLVCSYGGTFAAICGEISVFA